MKRYGVLMCFYLVHRPYLSVLAIYKDNLVVFCIYFVHFFTLFCDFVSYHCLFLTLGIVGSVFFVGEFDNVGGGDELGHGVGGEFSWGGVVIQPQIADEREAGVT